MFSGAVYPSVGVGAFPSLFGPAPLVLVALRCGESGLRLEVHHLFLSLHFRAEFLLSLPSVSSPACRPWLALSPLDKVKVGIELPTSLHLWQTGKPVAEKMPSSAKMFCQPPQGCPIRESQ